MLSAQIPSSTVPESNGLKIIQEQVGHEHASTTSIYTCVSSDFRTRTLRQALDQTLRDALHPNGVAG
jgi:integrase/recombinase XerC